MSKFINLFADLPSEYYSYLLSKTKAEKELLEFLGYQIEQTTSYRTRVEYTSKQFNCSRIDLAVLDTNLIPKEIIEAKFYYSFNGQRIYDQQLAKKSEVEKDVMKLKKIPDSISKYFVLFLVHYDSNVVPELFPYSGTHNKIMSEFLSNGLHTTDLRKKSADVTINYLMKKGLDPQLLEFDVGSYNNVPVILQVFTCSIN